MPGTKIINVLRDDKFEDILRIFQSTPSQEVIFVMPQKSKFLSEEGHFTVMAAAAKEQDKNILILSSNPFITDLALQYNFGVLSSEKNTKKTLKPRVAVQTATDEEEEEEEEEKIEDMETIQDIAIDELEKDEETEEQPHGTGPEEESDDGNFMAKEIIKAEETPKNDDNIPPEEDYQILTAARVNRTLDDIIKPQEEKVSIKILKKAEKPLDIGLRKETNTQSSSGEMLDQIQSVWQTKKRDLPQSIEKKLFKTPFVTPGIKIPRLSGVGFHKKLVTLLGISAIILLGIVIYVSTGSAQIIIKPRISTLDFNIKVESSDSFPDINQELKRIPGQLFSVEKSIEESFPATGERDVVQKARGKIIVYNEYGTTPQALIATTRFESASGLIFHTLKTIIVPGTTVQNGKITPGSVEVEIIADKAGDTYNISAGKFTIPAFKEKGDNDRYQKFYGISKEDLRGGIIGKAKVITEQDYITAKQKIEEKLIAETKGELNQQTAGLKILTPIQPIVEDIKSNAQIDEAINNFTLTAKARIQTIGFKESDLYLLISLYIEKANNLVIINDKLKLGFESVQFDKTYNKLEFVVTVKGPAFGRVDQDKIISDLIGKKEAEITSYIKSIESISSARVILSPFWVKKVPTNKDSIKIVINYD